MLFVQSGADVLKEAFRLFKTLFSNYIDTVLDCIKQISDTSLVHKLSVMKALLQTSKLG